MFHQNNTNALEKGRFFIVKIMNVDYIIVGFGLSGLCLAEKLRREHKTFVVYDNQSQDASLVAGGIFNPVILKRFTLAWNAQEQAPLAKDFYTELEQYLGVKLVKALPILRRFNSLEEQNNWFDAADKTFLEDYLNTSLIKEVEGVNSSYSFGKVVGTGILDTNRLVAAYKEKLLNENLLVEKSFDYDELSMDSSKVNYKEITAKQIVFCEGFGLKQNPYFDHLQLVGNKGEYITIKCDGLELKDSMLKFSLFVIPLGDQLFKVGATYNRDFQDRYATSEAKEEIVSKLEKVLSVPFEVVKQEAGVRPTTKDRRPLLGQHPTYKNIYVNNGFGSRGIIMAPSAANWMFNFIEKGIELPKEVDIKRFY